LPSSGVSFSSPAARFGFLIVGDPADEHCAAVARVASDAANPLVISADTASDSLEWSNGVFLVEGEPVPPIRGWLRRLSPEGWTAGVVGGSEEAAVQKAKMLLLTAFLRHAPIDWLTGPRDAVVAENKLDQFAAASEAGARVPNTRTTGRNLTAWDDETVVKSLGPGHFFDARGPRVVYTQLATPSPDVLDALRRTPFLLQQRLFAERHHRVVTVHDTAWAASLDASAPLDWRSESSSHGSFVAEDNLALSEKARSVARELRLGYSSQDWIETDHGLFLVDVNPGGQWLFLPDPMASEITSAIANWLTFR